MAAVASPTLARGADLAGPGSGGHAAGFIVPDTALLIKYGRTLGAKGAM